MDNMDSIKQNAKNKSCKGIPINYKNQIILLDPKKVKKEVMKFAITASLIIGAISLGTNEKVREIIKSEIELLQESHEEKVYNKNLEKSLNTLEDSIKDNIYIPVNTQIKTYDSDLFYKNLATNILQNGETGYIYLDAYIKQYGYNSKEIQNIIDAIVKEENVYYTDITNFLDLKLGIKTYEEFRNYCLEIQDKYYYETNEEKNTREALEKANNDLTTHWVYEIQNSIDPDLKLYEFYNIYKDEELVNELIIKLGFSENKDYINLEEYLLQKGYNSKEEWENYYLNKSINSNGRNM